MLQVQHDYFFVAMPLTWQMEICVSLQIQETCFILVHFILVYFSVFSTDIYLTSKLSKARDTELECTVAHN